MPGGAQGAGTDQRTVQQATRPLNTETVAPGAQTQYFYSEPRISAEQRDSLRRLLETAERPLVIVGRIDQQADREAVRQFIERHKLPVIVDVLSGLRFDAPSTTIHYTDYQLNPDLILHLGGQVTGKRLLDFLASRTCPIAHVDGREWRLDPQHNVTHRYLLPLAELAQLTASVKGWQPPQGTTPSLAWGEAAAVRMLLESMDAGDALFSASSLSIRHLDNFAPYHDGPRLFAANRGCSGIDGCIATAAGYAAGLARPTTLLIGDLAFLHDLNSLALVARGRVPLRIVVLNNDGGAIFGMLPIQSHPQFVDYWQTPHGLSAEKAAEMFGLPYISVETEEQFSRGLLEQQGIIELHCAVSACDEARLHST